MSKVGAYPSTFYLGVTLKGKLLALHTSITLDCKCLPGGNTIAYWAIINKALAAQIKRKKNS
jgi:hypothetical protein